MDFTIMVGGINTIQKALTALQGRSRYDCGNEIEKKIPVSWPK